MATIRLQAGKIQVAYGLGKHQWARSCGNNQLLAKLKKQEVETTISKVKAKLLTIPSHLDKAGVGEFLWTGTTQQSSPSIVSTVGQLVDGYLNSSYYSEKAPITKRIDRTKCGTIKKVLGERTSLQSLSESVLQKYIDVRKAEVVGKTIKKEIDLLRAIWNSYGLTEHLVEKEWRSQFPKKVRYPKFSKQPKPKTMAECKTDDDWKSVYLQAVEVQDLLELVKRRHKDPKYSSVYGWVYPAMAYCLFTSFRRSTMIKQLVSHLNFNNHTLTGRIGKEDSDFEETLRTVPMFPELEAILKEYLDKQHSGGDVLFSDTADEEIYDTMAVRAFHFYLKGTKFEKLPGWHRLRHSFVSVAAAKGIPLETVAEFTGHHSEVTARIYRHVAPGHLAEKMKNLYL